VVGHEGPSSRAFRSDDGRNIGDCSPPLGFRLDVTPAAKPQAATTQVPRQRALSQVAQRFQSRPRLVQPPAMSAGASKPRGLTARQWLPMPVGRGDLPEVRTVSTERAVRPAPACGLVRLALTPRTLSLESGAALEEVPTCSGAGSTVPLGWCLQDAKALGW